MRVISGEFKGRRLKAVPGNSTRPTSDKIKESVFHMLGPYFSGGHCLDLFAGSGALGIEALSRGINNVHFNDRNGKAIQTIKNNLQMLNVDDGISISRLDAERCLETLAKENKAFDLILVDPPYLAGKYETLIEKILEKKLIKENGLIYCEHDAEEYLTDTIEHLHMIKQTTYNKTTSITIYRYNNAQDE